MTVQRYDPALCWDVQAELGEGPCWVGDCLWFTDIKARRIHRFRPADGDRRSWDAPSQIGFLLPAGKGRFVAGMQDGLYAFDPASGHFDLFCPVEAAEQGNRINDGTVDPDGRLWFGTMDDGERRRSGAFYRFAEGRLRPAGIDGIAITNGPAFSPDGRVFYWVDTLAGKIHACDCSPDGELGPSRLLIRIDPGEGFPDGLAVDSEGTIWVALYAGWEVRRFAPSGKELRRVRFPVANLTKIAFGGPGLRTAYATTARQKLSPSQIAEQPLAGALFAFEVDVPGVACPAIGPLHLA